MVLTLGDLELLKQLRAAGGLGHNVRELNIRVTLDRLVKGGHVVGRPMDRHSVQYRMALVGPSLITLKAYFTERQTRPASGGERLKEIPTA
jgi:hypothetical protein